jgi:hypothetical protein
MELGYEKLMRENNLKLEDLNQDARNGIANVKAVMIVVNREAKKGKSVSDLTWSKLRTNDKWICGEILETLDGTQRNNEDEAPFSEEDIIDEINEEEEQDNIDYKKENDENDYVDTIGIAIDSDLEIAFKQGKTRIELDELKNISNSAYEVIWKSYKPNEENGIKTSFYSLIETEKHIFTLSKN